MFKKFLTATVLSSLFAVPVNAAIMEVDGVLTEVGDLDSLLFSDTLLDSTVEGQVAALEDFLGFSAGSLDMQQSEFIDGENVETGNSWSQTFTADDSLLVYDFGPSASSIYYMLSLPGGDDTGGDDVHTHYFFDNSEVLQYAYISLTDMFSYTGNLPYDPTTNTAGDFYFKISRITHVSSVPEPAMVSLLGIGLLGLGFARRRRSR